jgi:hypothetical protein
MPGSISGGGGGGGVAGRDPLDPVEFGDPATAKLRYDIVPAGVLEGVFSDDFTTDTLANGSRYPSGFANFSVSAGRLRAQEPTALFTSFTSSDDIFVSIRSSDSGAGPLILPLLLGTEDNSWLYLQHYGTDLKLFKRVAGVYTNLLSISVPSAVNGDFVYLSKQGSTIVCERFTTDPMVGSAVLKGSFTYQLTAAELAIFGGVLRAGVRGYASGQYSYGDNLRAGLRPPEQRRILADVDHPAGGVVSTVVANEKGPAAKHLPSARKFVGAVEQMPAASYAAFAVAPTPDRVTLPGVPAGRVIAVSFLALWNETLVGNGGRAALFIGGQQVRRALINGALGVQEALMGGTIGLNRVLSSCPYGLLTNSPTGNSDLGVQTAELPVPTVSGVEDGSNRGAGVPCFVVNPPSGDVVVEVRYKVDASRNVQAFNRTLVAWVV